MSRKAEQALDVLGRALGLLDDAPGDLGRALAAVVDTRRLPRDLGSLKSLESALRDASVPFLPLGEALARWDYSPEPEWAQGTVRNTAERRRVIYSELSLPEALCSLFSERVPVEPIEPPTVIGKAHEIWAPRAGNYWNAYQRYLRDQLRWDPGSIAVLDEVTTTIVSRLSNPAREAAYQTKGLVVGYVQSGKTANFTGLIAKAIDSGYRLIVVLAGTLDILRNQTQRRIDKELVGQEQLQEDPQGNEYAGDREWGSFVRYSGRPDPQIARLTGRAEDYKALGRGIESLEFKKPDPRKRLNDPNNLSRLPVRLAIVKKNSRVLGRLVRDLRALRSTPKDDLPALVIDDESDQASINTREKDKERGAVNREIVALLSTLKRSQYVGYTATPFANALVNPTDPTDIFPKDFLISLPRPKNYMGVADFFDVGPTRDPEKTGPNEAAFVRHVEGDDGLPSNLLGALDAFVLSGALKLYREAHSPLRFTHHTMLVHGSTRQDEHRALAKRVTERFRGAGYGGNDCHRRLERMLDDFRTVSATHGAGLPFPPSFRDVVPLIRDAHSRIVAGKAVRIVNAENKDETPDFESGEVWSILVGGAKLSRGYTVEGLTTSYYRRTASTADTLMQMGRWFGFRRGYRDLVRLFIGTDEPIGKKGSKRLNLLAAFRALCLDEEEFRKEIKKYADDPTLTPAKVVPLVPFHMLQPTSRNKMRWARLVYENLGGTSREKTGAPVQIADIKRNQDLVLDLLNDTPGSPVFLGAGRAKPFKANLWSATPDDVLGFLGEFRWTERHKHSLRRELSYLKGAGADDPRIKRWVIVAPLPERANDFDPWPANRPLLIVRERSRVGEGEDARYGVFTEPDHREVARSIAGFGDPPATDATKKLARPGTAVMLLYAVKDSTETEISVGFALSFPPNGRPAQLRYAAVGEDVSLD